MKIRCKCGYCGIEWYTEQTYAWKSYTDECAKCGEKKNIFRREQDVKTGDVFGYRFSPAFPVNNNYGYPYND